MPSIVEEYPDVQTVLVPMFSGTPPSFQAGKASAASQNLEVPFFLP